MENVKTIKNLLDEMLATMAEETPEERAEREREVRAQIEDEERKHKQEVFERSGVPARYYAESLDTFLTFDEMSRHAKEVAELFASKTKEGQFKSLVLIGNAGTGKTHLACSLVRAMEFGAYYRSTPDVVEEIRRAKSFNSARTEAEIVESYGSCRFLVLDEIGRGINANDEKYTLYQIINARYNNRRPTVLISNMTKKDFLQYIGNASADRLVESADILEMNGKSFRETLRG